MTILPHLMVLSRHVIRRDDDSGDAGDDSDKNCIKAVPGPNGHVDDLNACNAYYNYDPQFAPAVAVAVIFGVLLGIHLLQGILYKKVIGFSGLLDSS